MDKEHLKKMQEARKAASRKPRKTYSLTSAQVKYKAAAPKLYQAILGHACEGKLSKTQAIKAKCQECCGFYKNEVVNCTCEICPLWRYRPYQKKGATDAAV
jgi:hypothetical protein